MPQFSQIVVAVKDKVTSVVPDPNAVIVIARRRLPNLVGNSDALIRIRGFSELEGTSDASGRECKLIRRPIDIILRSRLYTDVSQQDLQYLTHETEGLLRLEGDLIDQFEQWNPIVNRQPLLVEGARVGSGEEPNRDLIADDPNFGMIALRLEVLYEQTLNRKVLP